MSYWLSPAAPSPPGLPNRQEAVTGYLCVHELSVTHSAHTAACWLLSCWGGWEWGGWTGRDGTGMGEKWRSGIFGLLCLHAVWLETHKSVVNGICPTSGLDREKKIMNALKSTIPQILPLPFRLRDNCQCFSAYHLHRVLFRILRNGMGWHYLSPFYG